MPFVIILVVLLYRFGFRAGTKDRAAMMKWLKEMLLLNLLLVPPMIFFPALCWLLAAHPDPTAPTVQSFVAFVFA
jgi:hypothetical protein